ncbi:MAG: hypothetical protein HS111_12455 [Kofleriaceae bacterium]|nr:hypothetical protein [Kofleriaceae bacterium]
MLELGAARSQEPPALGGVGGLIAIGGGGHSVALPVRGGRRPWRATATARPAGRRWGRRRRGWAAALAAAPLLSPAVAGLADASVEWDH